MQKTNKAIKKRFKLTARGKLLYWKSGKRHLLQGKRRSKKRKLSKWVALDNKPLAKRLKRYL